MPWAFSCDRTVFEPDFFTRSEKERKVLMHNDF